MNRKLKISSTIVLSTLKVRNEAIKTKMTVSAKKPFITIRIALFSLTNPPLLFISRSLSGFKICENSLDANALNGFLQSNRLVHLRDYHFVNHLAEGLVDFLCVHLFGVQN